MRHKRNIFSSRRAATTVEFALVAPILFLLIFGCIEFSRMMLTTAVIEQSAFEAARNVAVLGATADEGVALVRRELGYMGITDADITVTGLSGGLAQSSLADSTEQISVTVSVEFRDFMFFNSNGQGNIERTAILNTERF